MVSRRAAAALLGAALAGTGAAAAPLAPGASVEGEGPARVLLEGRSGDYLVGSLACAEPCALSLIDVEGRPLRRLRPGGRGESVFHLVVGDAPAALAVEPAGAPAGTGGWRLTLKRRVAAEARPAHDPVPVPDPPLSPAIRKAAAQVAAGEGSAAFWARVAAEGAPLVEEAPDGRALLTFVQRGAAHGVRLFAAPSGDIEALARLPGSDIWFASYAVPWSTRLAYQLAPDVPVPPGTAREKRVAVLATAQADPFNRHPFPNDAPDRWAAESTVALRDAPPQPGFEGPPPARRGALTPSVFRSAALGDAREATLYASPGFDPADPEAVLLALFDGPKWLAPADAPRALDALTQTGRLPPLAAVFLSSLGNETRAAQLPGNPDFTRMVVDELLPWARRRLGLAPDGGRVALAGASFGGLAAVRIALERPGAIDGAIGLSPSFWWGPEGGAPLAETLPRSMPRARPARFVLTAGLFETGHAGVGGIHETALTVRDAMQARGWEPVWIEYAGGHDWFVWRGALGDALLALYGR